MDKSDKYKISALYESFIRMAEAAWRNADRAHTEEEKLGYKARGNAFMEAAGEITRAFPDDYRAERPWKRLPIMPTPSGVHPVQHPETKRPDA